MHLLGKPVFRHVLGTLLFSGVLFLFYTLPVHAQPARGGTINTAQSSLRCDPSVFKVACFNVDTQALYGTSITTPYGPYAGRAYTCWAIYNQTNPPFDMYVPLATLGEFQNFIYAASGQDPTLTGLGVSVGPCCDTTLCNGLSNDCDICVNEGSLGPGNCCDWTCTVPGPVTNVNINGNPCCQPVIPPAPGPGPDIPALARGGSCANTCIGGHAEGDLSACDPWENKFNCCGDCSVAADGVCCPDLVPAETLANSCEDCGTSCPSLDGFCCGSSSPINPVAENRTNCADCAVCPDGYCSPGENQSNCCQDCNAVCGNSICCSNPPFSGGTETQANCCVDCGCWGGFSCVAGACHDNCDSVPYIHDSGSYQCTINSVTIHNQSIAGNCAIIGSCSGQCADGNIINWVNNCCTNWVVGSVPGACGAGGCQPYQRLDTRTCSSIATVNLTQCVNDVGCCTTWSNGGCQAGGCARGKMYKTRNCGGSIQTDCVDDAANCCSCDGWSTPGCGFSCGSSDQRWTRDCYPDNCASEDRGCEFYCGCAGTCCNNNGFCDSNENNGSCCDCAVCGGCGCQSSKGENCGNSCGDCTCPGGQVCDGGSCRLPSCGELGGAACCGSNGCRGSELGATFDCTSCCDGAGCYPDPWSGPSGSCYVGRHGQWAWTRCGLGGSVPSGYNNYSISQSTVGHRHGGSHFACGDGVGCVGFFGSGDGGALGPEYGSGTNWAQTNFPCWGGGNTCGARTGSIWLQVQDAEAWFNSNMDAW